MGITRKVEGNKIAFFANGAEFFSYTEALDGDKIAIAVKGELRSEAAVALQDEMMGLINFGKKLEINMAELNYISSAGQQAFLQVQCAIDKGAHSELCIIKTPDAIFQEFKKTGTSELLDIE